MLVLVQLKSGRAHLLSTAGPRALTRFLAGLGITRPRGSLEKLNAVCWIALLRGDDTVRVTSAAARGRVETVTFANACALIFSAAMNHARRKHSARAGTAQPAAAGAGRTSSSGPRPISDAFSKLLFNVRAPARPQQTGL